MRNKKEIYDDYEVEEDRINIDWKDISDKIIQKKWLFIISLPIALVVGYLIGLSIPKTYSVEVKLAPELSSISGTSSSLGGLSSIMRSFGLGSSSSLGGDAILPTLYPDLMNSKAFLVSLFDIPVESKDGKIKTAYFDYLANYQKFPWWSSMFGKFSEEEKTGIEDYKYAKAGALTKSQSEIVRTITRKIACDVDDKTGVITIDVKDQDPLICTTIADSTCKRLQQFITEYRTKKARQEMLNVQKQYEQALTAYKEAKQKAESFNDGNWDLVDEDLIMEKQALQNDMQLKFQTMSVFNTQLLSARSKYESLRPVYTVLDGASVPLKPASPRKLKYALGMFFLVFFVEFFCVIKRDRKTKDVVAE